MGLIMSDNLKLKLDETLPGYRIVESLREGSTRTSVFKLSCQGTILYLKMFTRRSRFEPEVFAYQNWMSAIRPYCPDLIAILDDNTETFGIVISALSGEVMRSISLTEDRLLTVTNKQVN